jgi:hypothetical protein
MAKDCNRCERRGLPIFPVIYAAASNEAVPKPLRKELGGQFGTDVTDKKLKQSSYILRGLEPGYIYLLYPNNLWRGYVIDIAGYPRYYADLAIEDMPLNISGPSDVEACEKKNNRTHYGVEAICIEDPDRIAQAGGKVYIAFTRHKWDKRLRAKHAADPARYMQQVVNLDGTAFVHAEVASVDNLTKHVIDFDLQRLTYHNIYTRKPLHIIDRHQRAERLIKAMTTMSGDMNKPGLIMALRDPLGISEAVNHRRNELMERAVGLDGKTTPQQRDDMTVASAIEDLRIGMQDKGADWDRYDKHLDSEKIQPVLNDVRARRKLAADIDDCGEDWSAWMGSEATNTAFQFNFDTKSPWSNKAKEHWYATCVHGSGTTKPERKVWEHWFDLEPDAPDNLLWQAATADQQDLIAYLAAKKIDKTFDITKGGKDLFKETAWYEHALSVLEARVQRQAQECAYTLATEKIAITLATQLTWLKDRNPKAFQRVAARMTTVLMWRGDLILLPKTLTAKAAHFVRWQTDAWLGKPTVAAPLRLEAVPQRANSGPNRPKQVGVGAEPAADVKRQMQALEGVPMLDLGDKGDTVLAFTTWASKRLKPGEAPGPEMEALLKRLKMQPSDLTLGSEFKINPLNEYVVELRNARLDRVFSVGTAFVQFFAFIGAWDELVDEARKGKNADKDKMLESLAGAGGSVASIIAAGMEVKAATDVIAQGGVQTFATRTLLVGAGGIALGVGLTESYFIWCRAEKLASEGDEDAANWTYLAAGATGFSAGFAFVGSIMGVASLTGVGLVVVISAAVLSAIVAMMSSIIGEEKTDTPLEKWLDRGRFGKHGRSDSKTAYKDTKDELLGLRLAIYAVTTKFRVRVDGGAGSVVTGYYEVAIPFYAQETRVQLDIRGIDPVGRERHLSTLLLASGAKAAKETIDRRSVVRSSCDPEIKDQMLKLLGEISARAVPHELIVESNGHFTLPTGMCRQDVSEVPYIKDFRFSLTYLPNTQVWPDFKIEVGE